MSNDKASDKASDKEIAVKSLIGKAAEVPKSEDALRFSQAACNVANALREMARLKRGQD